MFDLRFTDDSQKQLSKGSSKSSRSAAIRKCHHVFVFRYAKKRAAPRPGGCRRARRRRSHQAPPRRSSSPKGRPPLWENRCFCSSSALTHAELRTDQADLENEENGKSLLSPEMSPTFSRSAKICIRCLDVELTTVADLEKEGKAGPSPSAHRRRRRRGRCTRHSRPSRRRRSTRARTSPSRTSGQDPLRVRFIFRRNSVKKKPRTRM